MSSLDFSSVMAAGSAATGTPPELPSRFWISLLIVMSMKSYARSLFFDFSGTTQMLPLDPGAIWLPGQRNEPHWKSLISDWNRPYHHEPEMTIGNLPFMNATPMSSAFSP